MKGFEVITMVLIVGIVVGLAGTAYMWGVPVIEKRSTATEFEAAQSAVFMIDKKVTEIANDRGGTESMALPNKLIKVVPYNSDDPDNNSIIIEFVVEQPIVALGQPVFLGAESFDDLGTGTGTYGVSKPGITVLSQEAFGGKYLTRMKLHYRELDTKDTPYRGYEILLETDNGEVKTGNSGLTLGYSKSSVEPRAAANGGDLALTYIKTTVA